MPLYPADWDADTGHLSCDEVGAYLRIVLHYWRKGPPADDDGSLARIVRMDLARWRRVRPAIAAFFRLEGGVWRHGRVEKELADAREKRRRAIERAAAGGRGKAAKRQGASAASSTAPSSATSNAVAVLDGCPSPSPTEAEGSIKPSARSGREPPEARRVGASDDRAVDRERDLLVRAKEAEDEALRCVGSDPDRARELRESANADRRQQAQLRRARLETAA